MLQAIDKIFKTYPHFIISYTMDSTEEGILKKPSSLRRVGGVLDVYSADCL